MVVFDNRRVLHGRAAFDPATGHRHLQGFYVDRGEFDSRLRVLARTAGS
jgi:gamma-butyrobetaine dioxygenase